MLEVSLPFLAALLLKTSLQAYDWRGATSREPDFSEWIAWVTAAAPAMVVQYGIFMCSAVLRMEAESERAWAPSVVLKTSEISPFFISSTICGRPSMTLLMILTGNPAAWRYLAVPRVATMSKPMAISWAAGRVESPLSASLTEMKTVPESGSLVPPPI